MGHPRTTKSGRTKKKQESLGYSPEPCNLNIFPRLYVIYLCVYNKKADMIKLEPYIRYNGNCEEAFNFYRSVLGGEFAYIMRHQDNPEKDRTLADEDKSKILHIALPVGEEILLMGADVISDKPVDQGENISLAISIREESEVRRLFDGLSAGGEVTMPLEKTFWADLYGEFTDKFGINWIVSRAKGEDA